ncbi:unannotated protein [freshwater metagenome]|uniref:Unannotated protein n=1 Tax=freshwater metagenome TaxID=449393 RepID=A0A6J6LXX6_9ZZZZ|nr:ABC transporter permease subunit [Actinomycetota bacterium]
MIDHKHADAIKAVPVRHPWRWVATAVIVLLLAMFINMAVTNPNFEWNVIGEYLFSSKILEGVWATVWITIVAMLAGIVLGVVLSVMRLSPNPVLSNVASGYIWFFRGTPVLVQLIFWFNLAVLVPDISLGIPFGPTFVSWDTNSVITPFVAALLGLGLNEAAYMAEISRAGIQSVDEGQVEASSALGMSRTKTMRRIVLPQAMRVIIPPTGNEVISMLKTTSLVSVVAMPELLYQTQQIYARTYQTIPLLIVASIWYLFLTSLLTIGQFYIERHYGKGSTSTQAPTFLQRLRRNVFRFHSPPPTPPSSTLLDAHGGVR